MNNPLNRAAEIRYIESVETTMSEARITAAEGAEHGTVVAAGYQSGGRGRLPGRSWKTGPGEGLMFTVILSAEILKAGIPELPLTAVPLLCGLAAAEAVEIYLQRYLQKQPSELRTFPEISIKWPNDILAGGRKLCGILCEVSGENIFAGIGINLNQKSFTDDLRRPACSVRMLTGSPAGQDDSPFSGADLLELLLGRLAAAFGNTGWREAVEKRLYMNGCGVTVSSGIPEASEETTAPVKGIISGIGTGGELQIKTGEGVRNIVSGELSFTAE